MSFFIKHKADFLASGTTCKFSNFRSGTHNLVATLQKITQTGKRSAEYPTFVLLTLYLCDSCKLAHSSVPQFSHLKNGSYSISKYKISFKKITQSLLSFLKGLHVEMPNDC